MSTDTKAAPLSAMISSGEEIYTAITGKSSANVEKVTSGLSSVADGALPFIESKVSFDLAGMIAGVTGIFAGVALVLRSLKKKSASNAATAAATGTANTAASSATTATAATASAAS